MINYLFKFEILYEDQHDRAEEVDDISFNASYIDWTNEAIKIKLNIS